jgi:hypothetical protein
MRFTRLSLAAIVAVGALGSFATAQPLEEAIKGVDVSGMVRFRYYNESDTVGTNSRDKEATRYSAVVNVLAPVADGLKFGTALYTDNWNAGNVASSAGNAEFNKFFFQYNNGGLTAKAGKFEIPTPWTQSAAIAGSRGNGVLALYSPEALKGWTFAAAAYLQTNALNGNNPGMGQRVGNDFGSKENLYALAAIGKVGPVGLQLWLANMEHVIDATVFGEVKFAMAGFNARGQFNYLKANDDVYDEDSWFYGLDLGYKAKAGAFGLSATAGYIGTNKDLLAYALDADNDGFIRFGKQLYYKTINLPDMNQYFIKGGLTYDKFGLEGGFGIAEAGDVLPAGVTSDKDTGWEAYATATYKYAKNLNLELYYSYLAGDLYKASNQKNGEIRFQAVYNF